MYPLKQSTALTVPVFAHDENGDAVLSKVDGNWTKRISKNGAAFGAMTITITEMENGWYSMPLSTSHTDTLGLLTITLTASGVKQINIQLRVSVDLVDDATADIAALNDVAATDIVSGGAITTSSGAVSAVTTCANNTDMRGTNSAALASGVNLTQIDGQATAGYNATLKLKQLDIQNSAGSALVAKSTGTNGHGLQAEGNGTGSGASITGGATGNGLLTTGGASGGSGIQATGTSNNHGIRAVGNGSGEGISASGGATGHGMHVTGGASGGSGMRVEAQSGNNNGILAAGSGSGAGLQGSGGSTAPGIKGLGGGSGGEGLRCESQSGSHGLQCVGEGNGHGLTTTGGATGNGLRASGGATSGAGIYGTAQNNNDAGMELVKHGTGKDIDADEIDGIKTITDALPDSGALTTLQTDVTQIKGDSPNQITKNVAFPNFQFLMVDETNFATPEPGKTVACQRAIDNGSFEDCATTTATEISDGMYRVNLADTDTNGDSITYKFTASGCAVRLISIVTQPT